MEKEMKLALAIEKTETKLDIEHVAIVTLQEIESFYIKAIRFHKLKSTHKREVYSAIMSSKRLDGRYSSYLIIMPREIFDKFRVEQVEHIIYHASVDGEKTPYLIGYPIYITEDLIECLEERDRMKLEQFRHWVK